MPLSIAIANDTLRLRDTTRDDLDFVLAAENLEGNREFVGQWTRIQHRVAFSGRRNLHGIIETVADNKKVGYVIISEINNPAGSVNLKRIVITEKGQGYGHIVLNMVKQLAFERLHAHRLWLDVKDFNVRARHLYESEGFVVEGTLRECIKVGDKYESLVIMSILQCEYNKFVV